MSPVIAAVYTTSSHDCPSLLVPHCRGRVTAMALRGLRLHPSLRVVLVGCCVLLLGLVLVSFLRREKQPLSREAKVVAIADTVIESSPVNSSSSSSSSSLLSSLQCAKTVSKERKQRNVLSHLANQLKRELGQTECRLIELQKRLGEQDSGRVASSGGWCYQDSRADSLEHKFDASLADALSALFKDQHVGSLGEGPGMYKRYLLQMGLVRSYHAYDGAPFIEESSQGEVTFLDLTVPQYDLPIFDWILCLEVAEHIPPQFEDIFLDNIVRHARKGLVLSWAKLLQEGLEHVNNKNAEDVIQLLRVKGFELDTEASFALKKVSTFFWFQENVNVYRRILTFDESEA